MVLVFFVGLTAGLVPMFVVCVPSCFANVSTAFVSCVLGGVIVVDVFVVVTGVGVFVVTVGVLP